MILLILFSCKDSAIRKKIEDNNVESKKSVVIKSDPNPTKFYIYKLDSIDNLYLIYAKKDKSYYKILSEKMIQPLPGCEKIKLYKNYSLDVISIVPDTSKISIHLDGILYKNTEITFEKDSIWDLYKSPQLNGLCFKKTS